MLARPRLLAGLLPPFPRREGHWLLSNPGTPPQGLSTQAGVSSCVGSGPLLPLLRMEQPDPVVRADGVPVGHLRRHPPNLGDLRDADVGLLVIQQRLDLL